MNTVTMALLGNPNAGKTTLFNCLTGSRQHVGNYPGVTVEKREGYLVAGDLQLTVVDLPGTYSLTAFSQDELVARDFLVDASPDVVVAVLDATNIERSLYLVIQILEMGKPVIVVLNMMDEVRRSGVVIDIERLSELLDMPVVGMVARSGEGKEELLQAIGRAANEKREIVPLRIAYGNDLDATLLEMEELIESSGFLNKRYPARWIGIKYLERDREVMARGRQWPEVHERLVAMTDKVSDHCRKTLNLEPEALIADHRFGYISSLLKGGVITRPSGIDRISLTDKLDLVLTNRLFGPIIMLGIIYMMFELTFAVGEVPMGWVESLFGWLAGVVTALTPDGLLRSMLVNGVIGGVGGVLGFTPLIMIMFLFIAFLEDSGYMARMAYMLDRVFRGFGLHGCSVVPFIIAGGIPGGCAVPGILATRTLRSPKEKIATVLTAPFLSCGAKVPVFLLMSAAFFPDSGGVALFWITLSGWVVALLVSRLLRSTVIRGRATPFVMELPPYRLPTVRGLLTHTWERVWQYVKKAGTVILAISILLWAAMTFPGLSEEQAAPFAAQRARIEAKVWDTEEDKQQALLAVDHAEAEKALEHSAAGRLGVAIGPVMGLAGFDWRTNIALIGGFAAKEVVVSTLGTAYAMGAVDADDSAGLSQRLARDAAWTPLAAISFIAFVLLYAPCFVTVVVTGREVGWKWAAFGLVFNTALAYLVAVTIFQVGKALL
ncbi:MAG: ferrous iron transport protein B [Desulfobulbus sp.]|jgi:ferrous iron transport protein B